MLTLFRTRPVSEKERRKAAFALFADGGGLAGWPGPAAVLCADGTVVVANEAAGGFAAALGLGEGATLEPGMANAIRAGHATSVTVDPGGPDDSRIVFAVMPLEAGTSALVMGRDTALESAFREALTESRRRYKELVEICGDFCWETGPDGAFAFVSPQGALGYDADALVGRDPATLVDPLFADDGELPFAARGPVDSTDVWVADANGAPACLQTTARPMFAEDGAWLGARGVCRNVTIERAREDELRRVQMRERLAAHMTHLIHDEIEPETLFERAASGLMRAVGALGCRILEATADGGFVVRVEVGTQAPDADALASRLAGLQPDAGIRDAVAGQALLLRATSFRHAVNGAVALWRAGDGAWEPVEDAVAGDAALQLGIAIEQIRIRRELRELSRTDGLTGLLNRRAFDEEIARRMDRGEGTAALFYVDLDNFKPVNDTLGHQKGDEALCRVAALLRANSRPGDVVARLGGDEFALWLDRTDGEAAVARAAELITASTALAAFSVDPAQPLGLSIGVAVWRAETGETLDEMTQRADAAMYEIKRGGKRGYVVAAAPDRLGGALAEGAR